MKFLGQYLSLEFFLSAGLLSGGSGTIIEPLIDRFNYDKTNINNYGPLDWDMVSCTDIKHCPGWPTNWDDLDSFLPYKGAGNQCIDCSDSDKGVVCGQHKQSPIHLKKKEVIKDRECNDRHLMRFFAGECRLRDMVYEVLPHVLRVYQPKQECEGKFQPSIDFSRGFPEPWTLSFTDISVPSQHLLDGKQYAAEVTLSHVYSKKKEGKYIGNVSILLEEGTEKDRYDFLDLQIRGWERVANAALRTCFPHIARNLDEEADEVNGIGENIGKARTVVNGFPIHHPSFLTDPSSPETIDKPYYKRAWHPYDWYIQTNTEYYFRYEGSMVEPPCLEDVHWRVLHLPVKIAPTQLQALRSLFDSRLNPETCEQDTAGVPENPASTRVNVNRPIQTSTRAHKTVFCECIDWDSMSALDQDTCSRRML